jgi:hypothetical protein
VVLELIVGSLQPRFLGLHLQKRTANIRGNYRGDAMRTLALSALTCSSAK